MDVTRIFILHRYRLLVEVLEATLPCHGTVEIVGWECDLRSAKIPRHGVDLLILDVALARRANWAAIRQLRTSSTEIEILIFGVEDQDEIVACLEAGADAYIPINTPLNDVVAMIYAHRQRPPSLRAREMATEAVAKLTKNSRSGEPPFGSVRFTPREREILELLQEGLSNNDIAERLHIAPATVKIHVHRILRKAGARDRREAVRLAIEAGSLKPTDPS